MWVETVDVSHFKRIDDKAVAHAEQMQRIARMYEKCQDFYEKRHLRKVFFESEEEVNALLRDTEDTVKAAKIRRHLQGLVERFEESKIEKEFAETTRTKHSYVMEHPIREYVEKSIQDARSVLANQRAGALVYPAGARHSYEDKFLLAEVLVKLCVGADVNCLEFFGVTSNVLESLIGTSKSAVLRLSAEERCTFVEETKREIEGTKNVRTIAGVGSITDKVVTTVTEYLWGFESTIDISVVLGNDVEGKRVLKTFEGRHRIVTTSNAAPRPVCKIREPVDVSLNWLAEHMSKFSIDRDPQQCKTPRRNKSVFEALRFHESLSKWYRQVLSYYKMQHLKILDFAEVKVLLQSLTGRGIFNPVLPLFVRTEDECSVLSLDDISLFLNEHKRTLQAKSEELELSGQKLVSQEELHFLLACCAGQENEETSSSGLDFLEMLLFEQLRNAIGKHVCSADLKDFLHYQNMRLFKAAQREKPFCFPVRRENFHPEGIVSVERVEQGESQCVYTTSRRVVVKHPMKITGKDLSFRGEAHVHSLLVPEFGEEDDEAGEFRLTARANAFCSFLVLLGTMNGKEFDAKYGTIVQNKDEIFIPLDFDTIPSAGEFKKATVSISPEMQEFAKMYRSMQLSSTLFALCIIQIKPQMERVLNLKEESLTKEILLTQKLNKLFMEYQISSDLLSNEYECEDTEIRLEMVKANVEKMSLIIEYEKQKEIYDLYHEEQASLSKYKQSSNTAVFSTDDELDKLSEHISDISIVAQEVQNELDSQNLMLQSIDKEVGLSNRVIKPLKSIISKKKSRMVDNGRKKAPVLKGVSTGEGRMQALISRDDALDEIDLRIIEDRNSDIGGIQRDMEELSEVFREVSSMVAEQGECIDNIESNISMSDHNVESAVQELRAAERYTYGGGIIGKIGRLFFSPKPPSYERIDFNQPVMVPPVRDLEPEEPEELYIAAPKLSLRDNTKEMEDLRNKKHAIEERINELNQKMSNFPKVKEHTPASRLINDSDVSVPDFSSIPSKFESVFEKIDDAIRPVVIKVGDNWMKKTVNFENSSTFAINTDGQKEEKNKCFDLLDALSKNGALVMENASLHILIASSHSFSRSVMNTLVVDNVNPMEKLEKTQKAIVKTLSDFQF